MTFLLFMLWPLRTSWSSEETPEGSSSIYWFIAPGLFRLFSEFFFRFSLLLLVQVVPDCLHDLQLWTLWRSESQQMWCHYISTESWLVEQSDTFQVEQHEELEPVWTFHRSWSHHFYGGCLHNHWGIYRCSTMFVWRPPALVLPSLQLFIHSWCLDSNISILTSSLRKTDLHSDPCDLLRFFTRFPFCRSGFLAVSEFSLRLFTSSSKLQTFVPSELSAHSDSECCGSRWTWRRTSLPVLADVRSCWEPELHPQRQ